MYQTILRRFLVAAGRSGVSILLGALLLFIILTKVLGLRFEGGTPAELLTLNALVSGKLFFSSDYSPVPWGSILISFGLTSVIVLIATIWSGILAFAVGYDLARRPSSRIWSALDNFLTLITSFPLYVAGLLIFLLYERYNFASEAGGDIQLVSKILLAGILLGSLEGVLGDWPRLFRSVFRDMVQTTYFSAALSRGQKLLPMAFRHARPHLIQNLPTRIAYFYGSSIVIESAIRIEAAGYQFLRFIREPSANMAYQQVMVIGLFLLITPVVIHNFMRAIAPEARTARTSRPS